MTDQTLTLSLSTGDVVIRLRPDLAPLHVERITQLASEGFYDGVTFHRVIPGFMAQGGCPNGTGMGGSDMPDVRAEFTNQMSFQRGIVGAARSNDPSTTDQCTGRCFLCPWRKFNHGENNVLRT